MDGFGDCILIVSVGMIGGFLFAMFGLYAIVRSSGTGVALGILGICAVALFLVNFATNLMPMPSSIEDYTSLILPAAMLGAFLGFLIGAVERSGDR